MTRFRMNHECEQARAWAALAPDDVLSEFAHASLESHLGGCPSCARFAAQVEELARLVRDAELVPLSQPVSIRSRHSRHRTFLARTRPVAAVAAVALMAVGVASRSPLPVEPRETIALDGGAAVSPDAERREMESLRHQREQNFFASDVELLPLPAGSASRPV
ncbi:MAG TPA: hypothetical protein VEY87_13895 [Gaiellaceae bacterium]|jgi:predicted anti-sigma-YlaC factor YlaD|nr:hypothetical protein [Gaiellaceae bacterium]